MVNILAEWGQTNLNLGGVQNISTPYIFNRITLTEICDAKLFCEFQDEMWRELLKHCVRNKAYTGCDLPDLDMDDEDELEEVDEKEEQDKLAKQGKEDNDSKKHVDSEEDMSTDDDSTEKGPASAAGEEEISEHEEDSTDTEYESVGERELSDIDQGEQVHIPSIETEQSEGTEEDAVSKFIRMGSLTANGSLTALGSLTAMGSLTPTESLTANGLLTTTESLTATGEYSSTHQSGDTQEDAISRFLRMGPLTANGGDLRSAKLGELLPHRNVQNRLLSSAITVHELERKDDEIDRNAVDTECPDRHFESLNDADSKETMTHHSIKYKLPETADSENLLLSDLTISMNKTNTKVEDDPSSIYSILDTHVPGASGESEDDPSSIHSILDTHVPGASGEREGGYISITVDNEGVVGNVQTDKENVAATNTIEEYAVIIPENDEREGVVNSLISHKCSDRRSIDSVASKDESTTSHIGDEGWETDDETLIHEKAPLSQDEGEGNTSKPLTTQNTKVNDAQKSCKTIPNVINVNISNCVGLSGKGASKTDDSTGTRSRVSVSSDDAASPCDQNKSGSGSLNCTQVLDDLQDVLEYLEVAEDDNPGGHSEDIINNNDQPMNAVLTQERVTFLTCENGTFCVRVKNDNYMNGAAASKDDGYIDGATFAASKDDGYIDGATAAASEDDCYKDGTTAAVFDPHVIKLDFLESDADEDTEIQSWVEKVVGTMDDNVHEVQPTAGLNGKSPRMLSQGASFTIQIKNDKYRQNGNENALTSNVIPEYPTNEESQENINEKHEVSVTGGVSCEIEVPKDTIESEDMPGAGRESRSEQSWIQSRVQEIANPLTDLDRAIINEVVTDSVVEPLTDLDRAIIREVGADNAVVEPLSDLDRAIIREVEADSAIVEPLTDLDRAIIKEVEADSAIVEPLIDLDRAIIREVGADNVIVEPLTDLDRAIIREVGADSAIVKPLTDFNRAIIREVGADSGIVEPLTDLDRAIIREVGADHIIVEPLIDLDREVEAHNVIIEPLIDLNREVEASHVSEPLTEFDRAIIRKVEVDHAIIEPLTDIDREVEADYFVEPLIDLNREMEANNVIEPLIDLDREIEASNGIEPLIDLNREMEANNVIEPIIDLDREMEADHVIEPLTDLDREMEADHVIEPLTDLEREMKTNHVIEPLTDIDKEVEADHFVEPLIDLNREVEADHVIEPLTELDRAIIRQVEVSRMTLNELQIILSSISKQR